MTDTADIARFADMLAAMGTEPRLRIVRMLLSAHPDGLVVGEDPVEDARRFRVTPGGVTLVTPDMLGQRLHAVE